MYLPISMDIARFGQRPPWISGLIATFGYSIYTGLPEEYLSNMVATTQSLLIEQFEDSPIINELVEIGVEPLQSAERAANQLYYSRDLDTITGVLLDISGVILGVERQGLTDEEYRRILKLWTFLNKSCGEPEMLISALKVFTNASIVHYHEIYPAKVYMQFTSIFIPPSNLLRLLQKLAVGGVKILLAWTNDSDKNFAFDGEGAYPPDTNIAGFGEDTFVNEGGKFVEFIS